MPRPNGNGPTLWGSRANGPVGWTVTVVSVLMLVAALYMYETREQPGAASSPPNAAGGSGSQSPAGLAAPSK